MSVLSPTVELSTSLSIRSTSLSTSLITYRLYLQATQIKDANSSFAKVLEAG